MTTNIYTTITPSSTVYATVTSGAPGASAYEIWVDAGYSYNGSTTIDDFLAWLKADSFSYTQIQSSAEWTITHNLNKYPSVTIVDSADRVVVGDVEYISLNQLKVSFTAAFSGQAYLN